MRNLLIIIAIVVTSLNVNSQWQHHSHTHDGVMRHYWVFLPQNFQENMPLVLSLQGRYETFEWYRDYTRMHEVADTSGFVLVYPITYSSEWNSGPIPNKSHNKNDVEFISDLIDTLQANYHFDYSRLYCCGFSNGGNMTYRLAGEIGHHFAAVAGVDCNLTDMANEWDSIRPIPLLHFSGTASLTTPLEGTDIKWPVQKTVDFWVQNNNCALSADAVLLPDIDKSDNTTVEKISYTDCSDETSVILYKIINGGHSWPGCNPGITWTNEGFKNYDVNAGVEIWNYFNNFVNPYINTSFRKSIERIKDPVSIYPNPTNGILSVDTEQSDLYSINITSLNGQLIQSEEMEGTTHQLDLSSFQKGVYFITIRSKDFVTTKKIIKY